MGLDGIIAEAARITDERAELDESAKRAISHLLQEAGSPAGLAHESTSSLAYFFKKCEKHPRKTSKNVKNSIKKSLKNVKVIDKALKIH